MKHLFLSCSFLLITLSGFSQSFDVSWIEQSFGDQNYCTDLANDSQNNVYVTGYFKDLTLGNNQLVTGNDNNWFNSFLAKYNTDGDVIWG